MQEAKQAIETTQKIASLNSKPRKEENAQKGSKTKDRAPKTQTNALNASPSTCRTSLPAAQKDTEDPIDDAIEDPTEDPMKDPMEDCTEDPLKDAMKDLIDDATEDPTEDRMEDGTDNRTDNCRAAPHKPLQAFIADDASNNACIVPNPSGEHSILDQIAAITVCEEKSTSKEKDDSSGNLSLKPPDEPKDASKVSYPLPELLKRFEQDTDKCKDHSCNPATQAFKNSQEEALQALLEALSENPNPLAFDPKREDTPSLAEKAKPRPKPKVRKAQSGKNAQRAPTQTLSSKALARLQAKKTYGSARELVQESLEESLEHEKQAAKSPPKPKPKTQLIAKEPISQQGDTMPNDEYSPQNHRARPNLAHAKVQPEGYGQDSISDYDLPYANDKSQGYDEAYVKEEPRAYAEHTYYGPKGCETYQNPPKSQKAYAAQRDFELRQPKTLQRTLLTKARLVLPLIVLLLASGYYWLTVNGKGSDDLSAVRSQASDGKLRERARLSHELPQRPHDEASLAFEPTWTDNQAKAERFAQNASQEPGSPLARNLRSNPPRPGFPEARSDCDQEPVPDKEQTENATNAHDLREVSCLLLELDSRLSRLEKERSQSQAQQGSAPKESSQSPQSKGSERKEQTASDERKGSETKQALEERSPSRASLIAFDKASADWELVGFSGTRVAIRTKTGTHFLRIGQSLDGVTIKGIDVERGRITTSEGVLKYR
ncbi:MAG: hypothetical protein K6F46_02015 [Desulfovibrio sp.]|nr:hypothetical protein [Desulfovibrio sp.]